MLGNVPEDNSPMLPLLLPRNFLIGFPQGVRASGMPIDPNTERVLKAMEDAVSRDMQGSAIETGFISDVEPIEDGPK